MKSTRLRHISRLLALAVTVACLVAILEALKIPAGLGVFIIPASLFFIWILNKFIRDNLKLAASIGGRRLVRGLIISMFAFIPILTILAPGAYVGNYVVAQTNTGIQKLQAWAAPEKISEEIKRKITKKVKKRIEANIPWYERPLVWAGLIADYKEIISNEVKIVTETIEKSKPKPVHIRMAAGFGKTALLCLSVYSTTWVILLFMRAFASLFGRIVVATDPPIEFDMRPSRYNLPAEGTPHDANDIRSGTELNIDLVKGETLYVRRSHEPNNVVPTSSLKLFGGSLMIRIRRGLVFLTKVSHSQTDGLISFHAQGGQQYVSVELMEGQKVIVDPVNLVGFSKSVRFRSHYDFSLAMLSMHRASSMIATGPGRIILSVYGSPNIHDHAEHSEMIYMDRLIMFGMDATFKIRAADGFIDYYASGCVVRPVNGSLFISTPGAPPKRNIFGAAWQLIKQVYIPI